MSVLTYISPFTLNKEALKNFLLSMSLTSSPDECDKNDGTLLTTPPIQQIFCHFTQAAILKPVNRLACLIPSQDASLQASAWLLPTLPPGKFQLHIVLSANRSCPSEPVPSFIHLADSSQTPHLH